MEKQKSNPPGNASRIILSIYIPICTVLVLIILLSPFQPTDNSVLNSDIYVLVPTSETNGQ
jgi:hypothetical protein